jgi:hypothetical protein
MVAKKKDEAPPLWHRESALLSILLVSRFLSTKWMHCCRMNPLRTGGLRCGFRFREHFAEKSVSNFADYSKAVDRAEFTDAATESIIR